MFKLKLQAAALYLHMLLISLLFIAIPTSFLKFNFYIYLVHMMNTNNTQLLKLLYTAR